MCRTTSGKKYRGGEGAAETVFPKTAADLALLAIAILVALTGHSKAASATGQCLFEKSRFPTLSIPIPGQTQLPNLKCQIPFPDTAFDPAATRFNALLSLWRDEA